MRWFRSNRIDIDLVDSDPTVLAVGHIQGIEAMVRLGTEFRRAKNRGSYPNQLGVIVQFNSMGGGYPGDGSEAAQLVEIEDAILAGLDRRALMVVVLTTNEMREFILYARQTSWCQAFLHDLELRFPRHTIEMITKSDPNWETYNYFDALVRREP